MTTPQSYLAFDESLCTRCVVHAMMGHKSFSRRSKFNMRITDEVHDASLPNALCVSDISRSIICRVQIDVSTSAAYKNLTDVCKTVLNLSSFQLTACLSSTFSTKSSSITTTFVTSSPGKLLYPFYLSFTLTLRLPDTRRPPTQAKRRPSPTPSSARWPSMATPSEINRAYVLLGY